MTLAASFDAKYPEEKVVLTFDFTAGLIGNESLSAVVSVSVAPYGVDGNLGTDPSPSLLLSGSAQISGKTVLQAVQSGKAGCSYLFTVAVDTSTAGKRLELKGILPVAAL